MAGTRRRVSLLTDGWVWFAVLAGSLLWLGTARPLSDPDIWWHVRTGQLILDDGVPHSEPWAFTALGRPWVPTAWLSDALLAGLHDAFGWRAIVLYKVVLGAALLAALALMLFRAAPSRVAAPVFTVAALAVAPFITERPQLISLLLVVWLAQLARQTLDGLLVPWWTVAVSYVWANLHGMWVLVPAALVLLAAGLALDNRAGWRRAAARCLATATACVIASALTPAGPRLAYWPLVVHDAASDINEWQPTELLSRYNIGFVLLVVMWVVGLGRAASRAPRSELLWMVGVIAFSLEAARNVAPAAILIAPFACRSLTRAFGLRLMALPPLRVPRLMIPVTAAAAVVTTLAVCFVRAPLTEGLPFRIVAALEDEPGTVKVLNSYNVGGFLTGLGAPKISVAIDGRTDNYDPAFVHRYLLATTQLVKWRDVVAELDPDVAVIGRNGTLATELRRDGWTVRMTDGDFALLDKPDPAR